VIDARRVAGVRHTPCAPLCRSSRRVVIAHTAVPSVGTEHNTLDADDPDNALEGVEIRGVSRIQRQCVSGGRRCDQQVCKASSARLSGGSCSREHSSVHPRAFRIKGQRIPRRSRPLQSILTAAPFISIFSRVWTSREFRESHSRDCRLVRQQRGVDRIVID
jgi:hypothetical protein